jgi:ketosteroid isomerase-like protein
VRNTIGRKYITHEDNIERYKEKKMAIPLEIVKDVYNCFAKGDIDGFLALCADDIEWVVNGPVNLEKCKSFKGRSGVQQFLDLLAGWDFSSFTPREFIVDEQTVVVLGDETGTVKTSGIRFKNRWAHVFDVQGEQIVRFREFLCHWTDQQQPPVMSWRRLNNSSERNAR